MEKLLHIDLASFVQTIGYIGVTTIVFAESGLFIGFFLPGDSLLFTAGFLASQGYLNIISLTLLSFIAAVLGDSVGYAFGRKVGPMIFRKEESFFFHKDHLLRAQKFYEQHGGKTMILARFMPVVRTFAPILAGVGNMHYRTFLSYNLIGGFAWAVGVTLLGYFLGSVVPGVDKYLMPIIVLIVVTSVLPPLIHTLRERNKKKKEGK